MGSHCVVHDFCRYLNSDRNVPLHCLVDSASDSDDSSDVGLSSADCGVDAAVGYMTDTGGASGAGAQIVLDDDLRGVVDVGSVKDVVDLFEKDVDADSCDVDGLLIADVGNDG